MPPVHTLRGALLVATATFLFAASDAAIKAASADLPPSFIVAARYGTNLVLLLLILVPQRAPLPPPTTRTRLVLLRALCLSCLSVFVAIALSRMPVGETVAITFLAPVLVTLLARPALGEKVGPIGWLAALAGFAGVLLIARPGAGLDPLGVTFALLTAVGSATYQLLSRALARTESTGAMLFYAVLVGTLTSVVTLPWNWPTTPLALPTLGLLAWIGVATLLGHFLFTAAYRHAPAATLAPVTYLHLGWAVFWGWLAFAHVPDHVTLAGLALVTAAGLAVTLRPGRPGNSPPPLAPDG